MTVERNAMLRAEGESGLRAIENVAVLPTR